MTNGFGKDNGEANPYLALRAAKIARNQARLAELGLTSTFPPTPIQAKRRRPSEQSSSSKLLRSPRHSSRPSTYVVPDPPEPRKKRSRKKASNEMSTARHDTFDHPLPPVQRSFAPNSVRGMKMDVGVLCQNVLGQVMEKTGKAHVMEESVRTTTTQSDVSGLSFNKYSGVQEWGNDALYLWVNLGNSGDVVNDFLDEGRQITWYGGSRMHDETNVIRRLIRVGKLSQTGRLPSTDGIILWCRTYCQEKKRFDPYICLGRLAYHSHVPGSRPLQFVWSLLDYDNLINNKNEASKRHFKRITVYHDEQN